MADILIRGTSVSNLIGKVVEIGYDAADCLYAFVDGGATDILEAIELPEHGDLIDLDEVIKVQVSSPYGPRHDLFTVKQYFSISGAKPTVVISSNKENKNAN